MRKIILGTALAALTLAPAAARAQVLQGTANGAQQGAAAGDQTAGPLGGLVGGAVGAGLGTANGALDTGTGIVGGVFGQDDGLAENRPMTGQAGPSFAYNGDVEVGTILPRRGIRLYRVPVGYDVDPSYRYTVVNSHEVIVDPSTRQVIQMVD